MINKEATLLGLDEMKEKEYDEQEDLLFFDCENTVQSRTPIPQNLPVHRTMKLSFTPLS